MHSHLHTRAAACTAGRLSSDYRGSLLLMGRMQDALRKWIISASVFNWVSQSPLNDHRSIEISKTFAAIFEDKTSIVNRAEMVRDFWWHEPDGITLHENRTHNSLQGKGGSLSENRGAILSRGTAGDLGTEEVRLSQEKTSESCTEIQVSLRDNALNKLVKTLRSGFRRTQVLTATIKLATLQIWKSLLALTLCRYTMLRKLYFYLSY